MNDFNIDHFKKLLSSEVEHLIVTINDEIIVDVPGDRHKVEIDTKILEDNPNAVLFHNHLGNTSFSESDIINTIKYNSRKMYLITQKYLFSIARFGETWNINLNEFECSISKIKEKANEEIDNLVMKGILTIDEAKLEIDHYIWAYISTKYEFEYKRKPIADIRKNYF